MVSHDFQIQYLAVQRPLLVLYVRVTLVVRALRLGPGIPIHRYRPGDPTVHAGPAIHSDHSPLCHLVRDSRCYKSDFKPDDYSIKRNRARMVQGLLVWISFNFNILNSSSAFGSFRILTRSKSYSTKCVMPTMVA